MYRRILVGYKDTEQGHDALELGQILARANGAEMFIATAPAEDGEGLVQLARSYEADLVVLGSTHRGPIGRVIPGAMVDRLLGDPPCAVAIAPPGFGRPADVELDWRPLSGDVEDVGMRVIGVGFDGSEAARGALDIAADLAVHNGAALRVYAVAPRLTTHPGSLDSQAPSVQSRAEKLREQLHDAVAELPAEARALPVFLWGAPSIELVAAAENGVDMLVLGSRGGRRMQRALHGGVSGTVIQETHCPVLISPAGVKAPAVALV
ncbi:MAG TPA: universal stress protein [Solirubrobacterales bacterium]|nr:universal stress protein [Solirubrobacterales bacterium]